MAEKQPWLGKHTFPTVWIYTCVLINTISVLLLVMLIIAELVLMVSDFTNYVSTSGHSYPSKGYKGESTCGFVEKTNAPKHLGSAVWSLLSQLSIVVLITLPIASDLAWRVSSYNVWGKRWVEAFFAVGIMAGDHNKGLFFYVVANAFYKSFVVILYMSQSFTGLSGSSAYPDTYSSSVSSPSNEYGSGDSSWDSTTVTSANWRRDGWAMSTSSTSSSSSGTSWTGTSGTASWAFWCGLLVLISIVPSVIASIFLIPWAAAKAASAAAASAKSDLEKASPTKTTSDSSSLKTEGTSSSESESRSSSGRSKSEGRVRTEQTTPSSTRS